MLGYSVYFGFTRLIIVSKVESVIIVVYRIAFRCLSALDSRLRAVQADESLLQVGRALSMSEWTGHSFFRFALNA